MARLKAETPKRPMHDKIFDRAMEIMVSLKFLTQSRYSLEVVKL